MDKKQLNVNAAGFVPRFRAPAPARPPTNPAFQYNQYQDYYEGQGQMPQYPGEHYYPPTGLHPAEGGQAYAYPPAAPYPGTEAGVMPEEAQEAGPAQATTVDNTGVEQLFTSEGSKTSTEEKGKTKKTKGKLEEEKKEKTEEDEEEKKRKEEKKEQKKKKQEEKRKRQEEKKKKDEEQKQTQIEEEKAKAKDLVEVDETRDPMSIVFIGHVDSGKSTISGNIMLLTGKIEQRIVDKYKKEAKEKNRDSWWLAYVMDISDDERAKGKTVEVGRATFETPKKRYTIFDAPGHANYVPNMIMGAAMADIAGLVISAKRGEFESGFEKGGQTREHVLLAKSLGIQKLVVIINKMDEKSVKWDEDRYLAIKKDLTKFLQHVGYNVEKNVIWLPMSGLTGENIMEKVEGGRCSWYDGPTLLQLLDDMRVPRRQMDPSFIRIPVLDKLKDRGIDIFGKVQSGTIKLGTKLVLMPSKLPVEVLSILNGEEQNVAYAKTGENIKFRLKGVEEESSIYKGSILCNSECLCPVFDTFQVEIKVIELLKHKPILSQGSKFMLHIHTLVEECKILKINGIKNLKTKVLEKVKYVKDGALVVATIVSRVPICAEKFEVLPHLGRFTIRDEGKTIALGKILKYVPLKDKLTQ